MEAINLTKFFKKYKNKWIALTEDNDVISVGKTLDSVIEKAKRKGFDYPITMRVPDPKCGLRQGRSPRCHPSIS